MIEVLVGLHSLALMVWIGLLAGFCLRIFGLDVHLNKCDVFMDGQ